jgi:hypothetical protein
VVVTAEGAGGNVPGAGRAGQRIAEVLVLGFVVGFFTISVWNLISVPAPLMHDEAVYAVQARALLDDAAPRTGVRGHRAPALALAGAAVQLVADTEQALRLVGLLAGVAALGGVWWLARIGAGPAAGVLAAAAVATMPAVMDSAASFLTDLPAAAALLACAGTLAWTLAGRDRAHPAVVLVAPLAALAFYLRYGSAVPIAALFLVAGTVWFSTLRRSLASVGATLGVGVALLVPHLVNAVREYGTPWGRVVYTAEAVGRFGETLDGPGAFEQYMEWFPAWLPGWPVAALGLAGVVLAVVSLLREGPSDGTRLLLFLTLPAVATLAVLGVGAHAAERFTLFPAALIASAGAVGVVRLLSPSGWVAAALVFTAPGLLLVLAGPATADGYRELLAHRDFGVRNNEPVRLAATWIADHTDGPCLTVSSYQPHMTWYSGCSSYAWPNVLPSHIAQRGIGPMFLVFIEKGKHEPDPGERVRWLQVASDPVAEVPNRGGRLGPGEIRRWEPGALRARVRR